MEEAPREDVAGSTKRIFPFQRYTVQIERLAEGLNRDDSARMIADSDPQPTPELIALQTAPAGRDSLQRELGRGGLSIVYLAREVALDRMVASKLLQLEMAAGPGLRERFLREARTGIYTPVQGERKEGDE